MQWSLWVVLSIWAAFVLFELSEIARLLKLIHEDITALRGRKPE